MIYERTEQLILDNVFLRLQGFLATADVYLKIESFNPGGSIKMKTALALIDDAERNKNLKSSRHVIESSSGNLGIAISSICAARGYKFTCVADKNTLPESLQLMRAYGTDVIVIDKPDANGGYLGSRLEYIKKRLDEDKNVVWLNQYSNLANPKAHSDRTAAAILAEFEHVDYLFVGAGTTGTLVGCVDRFNVHSPKTRIIAADSAGSVTFGHPPGKRHIPGLGASVLPPLFKRDGIYDFVTVDEKDTLATCRNFSRGNGMLIGGSTGTVLAAVKQYAHAIPPGSTVVAIAPDGGDRYLSSIYSDEWVSSKFAPVQTFLT